MKGSALVMLLGKKPSPGSGEAGEGYSPGASPAPEEPEANAELEVAAGDLISAVKAGDRAAVASAFEAMSTLCKAYKG